MESIKSKFWILATMLLTSLSSSAYDFEVDGIYYNIISMSNLEVGVTHKYESNPSNYTNSSYSGKVVIPEKVNYNNRTFTVTSILPYAMGGGETKNVTTVELPSSITEIKDGAFYGCVNLSYITIPEKVKIICTKAFMGTGIEELIIPDEIEKIEKGAFNNCGQLKRVIIGKNVSEIGIDAFYNCRSLLEVFYTSPTRPSIGNNAFRYVHSSMEQYVPSVSVYRFGKEYISFNNSAYIYSGVANNIEWTNNLKAYKCNIDEGKTEVNAGIYTRNLKATYSDGVNFTVEIPYTYTIKKAPMTLTVNNVQREYGEPNPAFTCSISGFVNGENESHLGTTPSFDCEATSLSNVGTYRILASLEAPNYEITYNYGTLSILKAPLSVSVVSATKVYGDQNPVFDMSFIGLKNGESVPIWNVKPTIITSANQRSEVGEYNVTIGNGDPKNYDVTAYLPGILSVTKRNLTAKANDCERLYGEVNPYFKISYIGFINGEDTSSLIVLPKAECSATKDSNAGKYPITVNGGQAKNYNFIYQDGQLTVNPLTVGFKNAYNSVTYNDMSVSTSSLRFNYVPEIVGPYNEDDFWLEARYLDKDNKDPNLHVESITGGDYAGNYINTNADGPTYAGKYIFRLTPKGTNPNIIANPSRAFLTVNRTSTNLAWDNESPIVVGIGETIDLGISYQADGWCRFHTDYDKELLSLTSEGEWGNTPHWYATGLKEGETTMYFSIECMKNDMGFYNFSYSNTLSKRIKVIDNGSGINDVISDGYDISVHVSDKKIFIDNKPETMIVRIYNLQGLKVTETQSDTIEGLLPDIYIVHVNGRSFKIVLR